MVPQCPSWHRHCPLTHSSHRAGMSHDTREVCAKQLLALWSYRKPPVCKCHQYSCRAMVETHLVMSSITFYNYNLYTVYPKLKSNVIAPVALCTRWFLAATASARAAQLCHWVSRCYQDSIVLRVVVHFSHGLPKNISLIRRHAKHQSVWGRKNAMPLCQLGPSMLAGSTHFSTVPSLHKPLVR